MPKNKRVEAKDMLRKIGGKLMYTAYYYRARNGGLTIPAKAFYQRVLKIDEEDAKGGKTYILPQDGASLHLCSDCGEVILVGKLEEHQHKRNFHAKNFLPHNA